MGADSTTSTLGIPQARGTSPAATWIGMQREGATPPRARPYADPRGFVTAFRRLRDHRLGERVVTVDPRVLHFSKAWRPGSRCTSMRAASSRSTARNTKTLPATAPVAGT